MVWVAALIIYYTTTTTTTAAAAAGGDGGDSDSDSDVGGASTATSQMGQPWLVPQSWLKLAGYLIIMGVFIYYRTAGQKRR